jgi:DNA-binding MarR family transcriptional regulator
MAQIGMNDLDSQAWRAFHKIGTSLLPHLSRQITNHSGISGAEYVVLLTLSELADRSISLNQLATELGWEISRMSHQIKRMEENGFVKKTRSGNDHRSFNVSITQAGKKIIKAAVPLQSLEINHCFSSTLTSQQKKTLIEISHAITHHMHDQHALNKKETK